MSKKISRHEMLQKFINWHKEISFSGVTFCNLTYRCDESKSKTVKGKKVLQKEVETVATLGAEYEAKCNRVLAKEGFEGDKFKAQDMIGKHHFTEDRHVPLVLDDKTNSKYYLVLVIENHTTPKRKFLYEGNEITEEKAIELDLFIPSYLTAKNNTPARGAISEDNNFYFRTLAWTNIIEIKIAGEHYILED